MTQQIPFVAILISLLVTTTGCDGRPSESDNQKSRTEVASTAAPVVLDGKQINAIIAAEKTGNAENTYGGKVFAIHGQVKEKRFEETANKSGTQRTLQLVVENPDYVSVDVTCYFAAIDESKVREIVPESKVAVRGKFHSSGLGSITLEGCLLDN